MEDENTMRSFYDIAGDVAKQWDTLSDSERRYYLNIQAGANQTQNLAAMLRNYKTVIGATNDAIDSNNSAQEENAKYLDSIEGRLKGLSTAWENLSRSVVDSDLIKGTVSFLTGTVKGIESVRDAIGTLPTAILGVIAVSKGLNLMQTLLVGLPSEISKAGGLVSMATGIAVPGAGEMGLIAQLTDARKRYQGLSNAVNEYHTQLKNVETAELAAMDARSKSNAAIQAARAEIGVTSRAEAEAVAIESRVALSEIEATGMAAEAQITKANSGLRMIAKSIVGIVAVTGTIMLAKEMYDVYQHAHDVSTILEDIEDTESNIASKESEINNLLAKQDVSSLTDDEKRRLAVLEAEKDVLEAQLDLENKKLSKAIKESIIQGKEGTGTFKEAEQYFQSADNYIEAYKNWVSVKNEIDALRYEIGAGRGTESDKARLLELEEILSDLDLDISNMRVGLAQGVQDAAELYTSWVSVLESEGKTGADLVGEEKEAFDKLHESFVLGQLDVEKLGDSYEDVFTTLRSFIETYGIDDFINFDEINFDKIKTIDGLIKQLGEQIEKLPKDEEITIKAKDESGEIIDKVLGKREELTGEEWAMIITAVSKGNWDAVYEYAETLDGEEKETFLNIVAQADTDEVVAATKDIESTDADKTVVYDADISNIESTDKNLNNYNNPVIRYVKYVPENSLLATGKNPGEPGGPAWLGDEGSRQHPMPELVVGESGAYLAGQSGWELVNLKSSDRVYTAAQTKRLLGGQQSYQFGASEIPRYAKGKKGISQSKAEDLLTSVEVGELSYKKLVSQIKKSSRIKKSEKGDLITQANQAALQNYIAQLEAGTMSLNKFSKEWKKLSGLTKEDRTSVAAAKFEYFNQQLKLGAIDVDKYNAKVQELNYLGPEQQAERFNYIIEALGNELDAGIINLDEYQQKIAELDEAERDKGNKGLPFEARLEAQDKQVEKLIDQLDEGVIQVDEFNERIADLGTLSTENFAKVAEAEQEWAEQNYEDMLDLYIEGKATAEDLDAAFEKAYGNMDKNSKKYVEAATKRQDAMVKRLEYQIDQLNSVINNSLSILNQIKSWRDQINDRIEEAKEKQQKLADLEEEQQKAAVKYAKELVRLQNELTKARSQTVKVYKEGIGWTYEKDAEAIREAQQAIEDLNEERKEEEKEYEEERQDIEKQYTKKYSLLDGLIAGLEGISGVLGIVSSVVSIGKVFGMFADGKNPGEPGGPSILGDGGNAQNPAPELVVGPKGSYLAGTNGWQVANLSSADRVYTAAQTKRLLGGVNRGTIPSAFGGNAGHEVVGGGMMSNNYTYNFDRLELPNVTDANSFVKELQNLPNLAIQMTGKR